jgi:hypothetical protein
MLKLEVYYLDIFLFACTIVEFETLNKFEMIRFRNGFIVHAYRTSVAASC